MDFPTGLQASPMLTVRNPFNGELIAELAQFGPDLVRAAITRAARYKAPLSRAERSRILGTTSNALAAQAPTFARLISSESGLGLRDTLAEVDRTVELLHLAAAEVLRDEAQCFAGDARVGGARSRTVSQREPRLGVIAAITPFNHPLHQVAHKAVPAIATNNRMVLRPSSRVPLSALRFAALLREAGLPEPMFQVLVGDARAIAGVLLDSPEVEMLSFTGGVEAGHELARAAGYRRVVLELGGNDALIVMDDACPEASAKLAAQGAYANSGQRCTAVKRILVQRALHQVFVEALVEASREWSHGDPFDLSNRIGCVIDADAAGALRARVDAAAARGGRVLLGNQSHGAAYAPTVVDDVRPDFDLVREETFGPVAPVITFDTVDEAIAIANASDYGLSSGLCTNRLDVIDRMFHSLEVGNLNVWDVPGARSALAPFGGIKNSGLGDKEGLLESMRACTYVKTLSLPWGNP